MMRPSTDRAVARQFCGRAYGNDEAPARVIAGYLEEYRTAKSKKARRESLARIVAVGIERLNEEVK